MKKRKKKKKTCQNQGKLKKQIEKKMWAGANAIKREREKRASRCGAGVIF